MATEAEVIVIIKEILKHQGMGDLEVSADSRLYDDGLGLDSLCVAELSVALEKAYGKDPYTHQKLPQTVSDIVAFYSAA
jgi:acyl carrier protein